jgi:hypothetical protein
MNFGRCVRWCLVASALVSGMFASAACAGELFRADTRHPNIVFAEGFVGAGSNLDPLFHLSGPGCLDAHGAAHLTSAYVQLTDREWQLTGLGTYVYRIVPDASAQDETAVYDVSDGLRHLETHWRALGIDVRRLELIMSLRTQSSVHGQHLTRRVPPESIASVDIYVYDPVRNASVFVRNQPNPGYRPRRTDLDSLPRFSSEMIAGIRTGGHPSQIHVVGDPNGESLGLCLLPNRTCRERSPHRMVAGSCATVPVATPGSLWQQALEIILD